MERLKELSLEIGKEVIVYGEWYGEKVQKRIQYTISGKDFAMFGVRFDGTLMSWNEVEMVAKRIGVRTVPVLYRGAPDQKVFDSLQAIPSKLAETNGVVKEGNLSEGIVISAIPMECVGHTWAIAKHKNPDFDERASKRKGGGGDGMPKALVVPTSASIDFIEEFWTAERLGHIATNIREQSKDPRAPETIPLFIKGMFHDVAEKEGVPEWTALSDDDKKAVGRLHPKKTQELLKQYLRNEFAALTGVKLNVATGAGKTAAPDILPQDDTRVDPYELTNT